MSYRVFSCLRDKEDSTSQDALDCSPLVEMYTKLSMRGFAAALRELYVRVEQVVIGYSPHLAFQTGL